VRIYIGGVWVHQHLAQRVVELRAAGKERDNAYPITYACYNLAKAYFVDMKKWRMMIFIKAGLTLTIMLICIGVGTLVIHSVEDLTWVESFYLAITSTTTQRHLFTFLWLLVIILVVAKKSSKMLSKKHPYALIPMISKEIQEVKIDPLGNRGGGCVTPFTIDDSNDKDMEKNVMQIGYGQLSKPSSHSFEAKLGTNDKSIKK
ncbi:hypothetical protein KI387_019867, partial [Taxus chinensis]